MYADLAGALEKINKSYKVFEHRGKSLSKDQVRKILKYGLSKGYKTTNDFTDEEVDEILNN
jgi:ribulose bisphosphate carboxylase small subunit